MSNKKKPFIFESDSPKFPSSLKNDEVTISEKISTPIKNYERKITSKSENHCDKDRKSVV